MVALGYRFNSFQPDIMCVKIPKTAMTNPNPAV